MTLTSRKLFNGTRITIEQPFDAGLLKEIIAEDDPNTYISQYEGVSPIGDILDDVLFIFTMTDDNVYVDAVAYIDRNNTDLVNEGVPEELTEFSVRLDENEKIKLLLAVMKATE